MITPKVAFSLKCAEHTYNCIITAASSRHYSLKTVCGCQCGRVISGHTCNALTQWNAFVSAQLHILDDPLECLAREYYSNKKNQALCDMYSA